MKLYYMEPVTGKYLKILLTIAAIINTPVRVTEKIEEVEALT